jgi:hypothetical protein
VLGVLIVALAGVLLWLVLAPAKRQVGTPHLDDETLEAEREIQDLDAFTTPEDADDELPDWGPGAPKERR